MMPSCGKVTIDYFDEEINRSLVYLRHNMFSFSSYPTNPFFYEKMTLISRYQILLKPVALHHIAARFTWYHQVISNNWTSITFNESDTRNPLGPIGAEFTQSDLDCVRQSKSGACPLESWLLQLSLLTAKNTHRGPGQREKLSRKKASEKCSEDNAPPLLFLMKFKLFHLTKKPFIIYFPLQFQLALKNSEMYSAHALTLHSYRCCSTGPSSYSGLPTLFSVQSSAQAFILVNLA